MLDMTIFTGLSQYLLVGSAVFLGQLVYAALGFGSGLVTISLLSLMRIDLKLSVPLVMLLCIPTEAAIVIRNRRIIRHSRLAGWLIPFIVLGLVVGTVFLKQIPNPQLIRGLGILIALIALYYLFFDKRIQPAFSARFWRPLIGAASGLLGGTYGISGPPLIIFFKAMKLDKTSFRTVLLSLFLLMSLFRLVTYTGFHLFNRTIVASSLLCLPFVAAGLAAGSFLHHRLPESPFRTATSLVLLISGLLLLA